MIHLIIDGYNLIRQVASLSRHESKSLEAGRSQLIKLLSEYKKIKRHKITVVFDGALNLSEFAPAYHEAGIAIRFSPESKSADDIIKEIVREEKDRALVVTSDQSICSFAKQHKSSVLGSPQFYDKLLMAHAMVDLDKSPLEKQEPAHKRWMTYKKGPSRRAPKKERKHKHRAKKL